MPIYEYRCDACGHEEEFLRKLSDPPLTDCPACGKATFNKKLSAAGFQLKGSGWYVTDFRGGAKPAEAGKKGAEPAKAADAAVGASTSSGDGGAAKSESSGDAKPTPPPAAGTT